MAYDRFTEGERLFRVGDYEAAIRELSAVITIFPSYSRAYGLRAEAYGKLGRTSLAAADQRKVESLNSPEPEQENQSGPGCLQCLAVVFGVVFVLFVGFIILVGIALRDLGDIDISGLAYDDYSPSRPVATPMPTFVPILSPCAESESLAEIKSLNIGVVGELYRFTLDRMCAPARAEVAVTFNNSATRDSHNWVLVKAGTNDTVAADGDGAGAANNWLKAGDSGVLAATGLVGPGESAQVIFTAPGETGFYQFVCTVPGHARTMFGEFIVN